MKTGFNKLFLFAFLCAFVIEAYAAGTVIATAIFAGATFTGVSVAIAVTAFAINMVVAAVVSKAFFNASQPNSSGSSAFSPNPGNRQQLPPATDNKLPVVYGTAFVGGIVTDLSISSDNQNLYYAISICEVTSTNAGQTPDTFTFGNIYYGGKRCIFGNIRTEYNAFSNVLSVSTNSVVVSGVFELGNGSQITFANTGSPTVYTLQSSSNDGTDTTLVFTTNLVGITNGMTVYSYVFADERSLVVSLLDESTGIEDTTVRGKINLYLYSNGSNSPVNTGASAIQIMSDVSLVYKWNSSKLMSNTVFAILKLRYSQSANIRGIEQTKFQITNSRTNTGDCFYDYLINTRYGAAIPASQIDTTSLNELTAYSNENFTYTAFNGLTTTQPRFKFNGVLDTTRTIMDNLQDMTTCCDCLLKYNEVQAKWGVIVQKPTYTVAMNITDSDVISGIVISPLDIAASYNFIECKFPDTTNQDAFASVNFDLAQIDPTLLYPNEPVNKVSLSLPLVNNSVTAQYIANRLLKSGREDLQVALDINYQGLQLDAGDIVTVTNANYGWVNKPFRITKLIQSFTDDGAIIVKLNLSEFNGAVYNDVNVRQFDPTPNTGIGDPTFFGTVPAPTISNQVPFAASPSFNLNITTSQSGIIQYAEIWYSAFTNPLQEQMYFAGTSAIQSNGNPWLPNSPLPPVTLGDIPSGNWYFFVRMVNSIASSSYSPPSALLQWRPRTFQYTDRYLAVAYADSITGTGFSFSPRGKTYYGLFNTPSANTSSNPADYTWFVASPAFGGTNENYLLYSNRTNRRFSFSVGNAAFIGIGAAFVPTETSVYDTTLWSGLEDGDNIIDLDMRTGQVTQIGTSAVSAADGLLSVTNNTQGTMVVALQKFLNFGNGVYSKNFSPASLTIDVYGRVVGFSQQDDFFFTDNIFSATAGQTSFAVNHIVGNVLVFRDGVLMPTSAYTETTTTVVLNNACAAGEIVEIVNMRAVSTNVNYVENNISVQSLEQIISWINNSSAVITWTNNLSATISWSASFTYAGLPYIPLQVGEDITFSNTGTPTIYTIATVDPVTKIVTFTTSLTGVNIGDTIYDYRASGSTYKPFYRITIDVNQLNTYEPTQFFLRSGYEQVYVNGAQFSEIDYDLTDNVFTGLPAPITGKLEFILFTPNNLGVPCSNITNTVAYSTAGVTSYVFPNNPLAMQVYANGSLLTKGSSYDYVPNTNGYNLNTPIPNNFTLLNQQTFARIGDA